MNNNNNNCNNNDNKIKIQQQQQKQNTTTTKFGYKNNKGKLQENRYNNKNNNKDTHKKVAVWQKCGRTTGHKANMPKVLDAGGR